MIIHKAFFAVANNIYGEWRGSIVGSQMCTFKCQNESDIQIAAHDALKYFLDNGTNNYRDRLSIWNRSVHLLKNGPDSYLLKVAGWRFSV
jgi:hypothetical protein